MVIISSNLVNICSDFSCLEYHTWIFKFVWIRTQTGFKLLLIAILVSLICVYLLNLFFFLCLLLQFAFWNVKSLSNRIDFASSNHDTVNLFLFIFYKLVVRIQEWPDLDLKVWLGRQQDFFISVVVVHQEGGTYYLVVS